MSLLTYSGITTKVKAMESRLLTDNQFREMSALEDVRSAAEYLKRQPAYADIFSNLDDIRLHRGYLEELLSLTKYRDFTKLYRFSSLKQRKYLDVFFLHYEIDIIKKCLRDALSHQSTQLDLWMARPFFEKHSHIDLVKLADASDFTEFLADLEGTVYHKLWEGLSDNGQLTVFDYELRLDLYYLKTIWSVKNSVLSRKEQAILDPCFGYQLDLLNLQWIYRAKKYYNLPAADIYALLVPNHYKLKTPQIRQMAEASSLDEFFAILKESHYGRYLSRDLSDPPSLEELSEAILNRIHAATSRKNPYTIAILEAYLYYKEKEIQKIVTTIEGIRYGLGANEIYSLAVKSERGSVL